MSRYDVVIVGAGPAGIFTALELTKKNNVNALLLEKGPDIEERVCPAREKSYLLCQSCNISPCSILSGWGGAGAFSDGKLTLSPKIGGWLGEYIPLPKLKNLINYVDQIYQEFGAPQKEYGTNERRIRVLREKAKKVGLLLVAAKIRHLGTERCRQILKSMRGFLEGKVKVKTGIQVERILTSEREVRGVLTTSGKEILSNYVVVAPGREGADWLMAEARRLGLKLFTNAVDIGVRVEVPAKVLEPLTSELYESKLIYYSKSFQDKVRTFCMNPYGEVTTETYSDAITVNGHSYADSNRKTDNTNFALLVSTIFTEPFKEPLAYGKYIARLANLLGEGIIIQRLGDLKHGRRSTPTRIAESTVIPSLREATPGDLSFALPFRYISDILEMIETIDKIAPGVNSTDTLLYGAEVKFYSSRLKLNSNLETEIKNLYTVGDGAGITRGLIQSSCAGVIAARSITHKHG